MYRTHGHWTHSEPGRLTYVSGPILTSPTIFHFIFPSYEATVKILVTFGDIGLSFSVYNIEKKNYLTSDDVWTKAPSITNLSFFRRPYPTLLYNIYRTTQYLCT